MSQSARDSDWYLGVDEQGISEVNEDGSLVLTSQPESGVTTVNVDDAMVQQLLDKAKTKVATQHSEGTSAPMMSTRGIKRDFHAMHHGLPRVGGERVYSVKETILHSLRWARELEEPKTYQEAIDSECHEEWQQAINAELLSIWKNNVWHKDEVPAGVTPLTTKWIFKIKRGEQGQIIKFKARLCVRGFEQELGIDFEEVFAPVMRHNSLRTLLAMAAAHDYEIKQMDVTTAFLNGELEEDVYIYAPEGTGFEPGTVLKLDRALYGLKQAPRVFNTTLNKHVVEQMGFIPCATDPCVYRKDTEYGPIFLAVYVDDLIIIGKNVGEIDTVKKELCTRFEMEDKGDASFILGMLIERDRVARTLKLTQSQYATDVVKKFGMDKSKCYIGVPMRPDTKLSSEDCPVTNEEMEDMKKVPYRSAIGSLMYLATCTRPDIAYAVSMCASYMHNPGRKHWETVKGILAYVNATRSRGIIYGSRDASDEMKDVIYLYADADHAGNVDNRRSRTGYVTMLHGGAVLWKTRLQERTSMSSAEAEYYAASEAFGEARWFRMFLGELKIHQLRPTVILEDNASCIKLSENPVYQYRTKQIDIRHHQIREAVRYKEILLSSVGTNDQVADALTKALAYKQFEKLTNECMMSLNIMH